MRASGAVLAPPDEPGTHACWRFDDDVAFHTAALEYLAGGLARHERVLYLASRDVDVLRREVTPIGDVDRLVDDGALVLRSLADSYDEGAGFDPAAQVDAYRELIAEALGDGFSGIRVAADVTTLVATEDARRRFVQYELAVDHVMSTEPMSAMCAYDGRAIGPAVAELAAVHPLHHGCEGAEPAFQAFYDDGRLHLAGEVDLDSREVFALVAEVAAWVDDPDVVIDVAALGFVEARALAQLARRATRLAASGRHLRLVGAGPLVVRCGELLGLHDLITWEAEA